MVIVGNTEPGPRSTEPRYGDPQEIDFIGSAHATVADLKKVIESWW